MQDRNSFPTIAASEMQFATWLATNERCNILELKQKRCASECHRELKPRNWSMKLSRAPQYSLSSETIVWKRVDLQWHRCELRYAIDTILEITLKSKNEICCNTTTSLRSNSALPACFQRRQSGTTSNHQWYVRGSGWLCVIVCVTMMTDLSHFPFCKTPKIRGKRNNIKRTRATKRKTSMTSATKRTRLTYTTDTCSVRE